VKSVHRLFEAVEKTLEAIEAEKDSRGVADGVTCHSCYSIYIVLCIGNYVGEVSY